MRYVTVYYTFLNGYSQPKFHKSKQDAMRYFKWAIPAMFQNYRKNDIPKDAPCSYGFPHRNLMCMSIRDYNKITKGTTND